MTVAITLSWARITSSQEGGDTVDGDSTQRVTWQLFVVETIGDVDSPSPNITPKQVLALSGIPQRGDPLRRYEPEDPEDPESTYVAVAGDPVSDYLVVVDRQVAQDPAHPSVWKLTVVYGGKTDPIFELPRVEWLYDEYQEFVNYDVNGRLVENSALDPISGGMPIDAGVTGVKITRNLAWDDWNVLKAEPYLRTLNAAPFVLCRQYDGEMQLEIPPGQARLKSVTQVEQVRAKATTPAEASYYWTVTAHIVFDDRTYALPNGKREKCRHRYVVPDRGFNKFVSNKKTPIYIGHGEKPTEEQFLDGAGSPLPLPSNNPPALPFLDYELGTIFTSHDYYSAMTNTAMTVDAPGVMANDQVVAGRTAVLDDPPSHHSGAFTLNTDGSFTYTSVADYVGWDSFTYHVEADDFTDSASTTVIIRVGPRPVFLAFDRYRYADWSVLSDLLEDW